MCGEEIALNAITKNSWHNHYKNCIVDPMMDNMPFVYNKELIENGLHPENKRHYPALLFDIPRWQLKRANISKAYRSTEKNGVNQHSVNERSDKGQGVRVGSN